MTLNFNTTTKSIKSKHQQICGPIFYHPCGHPKEIYMSQQFPSVTPVTDSQSLYAIFARLLRLHVLDSSASWLCSLFFPTSFRVFLFFFLIPATKSAFIQAICHLPCVILCPRHFNPLFSILFRTDSLLFLLLLHFLLLIMDVLAALLQISVPALKNFVLNL